MPVEFTIDAKDAGDGELAVQITVCYPACFLALLHEFSSSSHKHRINYS